MTDDDRLQRLLRSALPPIGDTDRGSSRDLWPLVVDRLHGKAEWSWLDVGLAAIVVALLLIVPEWLWLLAYHL